MGRFDAVATRYGCQVQGATEVALTNLDVLGYLAEVPICVAYRVKGEPTTEFPVTAKLDAATPVLKTMPGWKTDVSTVCAYAELPEAARRYVEWIE
ncbi:adenylosuccinate synthetase [Alicyclobacillus sp. SP_1]|uniref:adenylosuccinate synthetase n=1 Tax=Alicyclobacillus sp. SP_1 TaxID=2942475 RepID=UPI002804AC8F|nr:adenylosuccinate synthetase [Alicyclobacillus sp. SP_1]